MQVDESLVAYIAATYYNLSPILGSIKPLCGYNDKNFVFTDSADHRSYVLKIVNKDESIKEVTDIVDEINDSAYAYSSASSSSTSHKVLGPSFVVPKVIRTTGDKLSTFTSVRYHKQTRTDWKNYLPDDMESSVESIMCNIKLFEYFDGITMFDYINSEPASLSVIEASIKLGRGDLLYRKLGRVCNELFVFLSKQRHLIEKLKEARGNSFPWQLKTCEPHLRRLLDHLYPDERYARRLLVERVLDDYKQSVQTKLENIPEFILHSDLCNKNILLDWRPNSPHAEKLCVIDFQDLQVGQQVIDLAIMMFYNVIEQEHTPFEEALKLIPRWIYQGYQSNATALFQLKPEELLLVPTLMKLRLCMSLLYGQLAFEENPNNTYVMQTNQRGWQLLELMSDEGKEISNASKLVDFWLKE